MKKAILVILLIIFALSGFADVYVPPFPLTKNPITSGNSGGGNGTGEEDDEENTGHRAPARPVFCSIDFDAAEVNITGYDSAEIESYEICDAERHACIFATNDCAEFIAELANTHETVYLIFYFDSFALSGYFSD